MNYLTCEKPIVYEPPCTIIKLNDNPITKWLAEKFGENLEKIEDNGPTAQLLVQYFKMVGPIYGIVKQIIHTEISSVWDARLNCSNCANST